MPLLQDDQNIWGNTSGTDTIAGAGGICPDESAEGRKEKNEWVKATTTRIVKITEACPNPQQKEHMQG